MDDIPVTVCSRSLTNLLDRQLDELSLPEHDTKLDKWTRIEQRENELVRGRKAQAAHMNGPDWERMELAIPMAEPREPSKTEREIHELTHLPPQQWCDHFVKGRGVENPHKRVTLERAESTLPVIAFDFCFIKCFWERVWLVADEGATCLVLVDVCTGYLNVHPAAAKTVTDYLVEGVRGFGEQFLRKESPLALRR